jgi:hypothetical protein
MSVCAGWWAACANAPPSRTTSHAPPAWTETGTTDADASPASRARDGGGTPCEVVANADLDVLARVDACLVAVGSVDASTPLTTLRVTVSVPRVARGADGTVRVSLVNTGVTPVPVVLGDDALEVRFADAQGNDPTVVLGDCPAGVVTICTYCDAAVVRIVVQPGGEVHRDIRWSGTRARWSVPKDGGACERSPAGVVPAGEYTVQAFAHVRAYDLAGAPADVPPGVAKLVVLP